jgi:hypothetical protein
MFEVAAVRSEQFHQKCMCLSGFNNHLEAVQAQKDVCLKESHAIVTIDEGMIIYQRFE